MDFYKGEVLKIDKYKNWTSFDVVNKLRNLIRKKYGKKIKIGHAGTLDPLATGLLIICSGLKTKEINSFMGLDKEYIATIGLGATTPSFDLETVFDGFYPTEHINIELIKQSLKSFEGRQIQTPPIYSAKKINGEKAYNIARRGDNVKIKKIEVEFKEIELLEANLPDNIIIRMVVSKGTYIRSFANDLGKKLKSGAYLKELRRTKIGDFNVEEAMDIAAFERLLKKL